EDGSILPVLVESRRGYQNLCRLITRAQLRSAKGQSAVRWDELPEFAEGLVALTGDEEGPLQRALVPVTEAVSLSPLGERVRVRGTPDALLQRLIHIFGRDNVFVEIQRHH